jgi:pilus assembly protein CpaB
MGAARIIVLSLAMVAAIGLAIVVRGMMANNRAPTPAAAASERLPQTPMVRVLVASRDLPVGTRLSPSDLRWQNWPEDGLNPGFFTDGAKAAPAPTSAVDKAAKAAAAVVKDVSGSSAMESLVGVIVHDQIIAGEPILRGKLVPGGEGGYLAVVLPEGLQALGIPLKVENGAGGFILPGDRVDVSQSKEVDAASGGRVRVTDVIVRNVRVLAIDQATKPAENANSINNLSTATLEVTPEAALALVEAMSQGDLHLALKSYADVGPRSEVVRGSSRSGRGGSSVKILSQGETVEVAVTP